jgi:hypothetical protein
MHKDVAEQRDPQQNKQGEDLPVLSDHFDQ